MKNIVAPFMNLSNLPRCLVVCHLGQYLVWDLTLLSRSIHLLYVRYQDMVGKAMELAQRYSGAVDCVDHIFEILRLNPLNEDRNVLYHQALCSDITEEHMANKMERHRDNIRDLLGIDSNPKKPTKVPY
jgi:hypothetical protein